MIKEMSKVQLVGPKSLLDECVRVLHAMAVLHLETVPIDIEEAERSLKRLPMDKAKADEKEYLEKALERVKNLTFLMVEPEASEPAPIGYDDITEFMGEMGPVEEEVKRLHADKESFAEELSSIRKYEKILRGFAPLISRLGGLRNFDILGLTIERKKSAVVSLLEAEVDSITGGSYELHTKVIDEATLGFIITFPRQYSDRVRYLVLGEGINEIRLPDEYEEMSLKRAIRRMTTRGLELPGLISEAEEGLRTASERWYSKAAGLKRALQDAIDEIGTLTYFAQTRFCFVMEGWVPKETVPKMVSEIKRALGGKVLITETEVRNEDEDLVPVYIKNPPFLRPFEIFVKVMPSPKYRSVDPTPYIALFFPTFFGLIVGDIGYGVIIFTMGFFLRRFLVGKKAGDVFVDAATVVMVCGTTATVFGFLFGELFGDLAERMGWLHPILFDRAHAFITFMLLSLGIGVGHVSLGLVIGAVNYFSRGKTKRAVGKISYLVMIFSALLAIGVTLKYLPEPLMTPMVALFIIAFVVLVAAEGFMAPLEIISTLGNLISYIRIMAVGTASVVMAMVANKMAGITGSVVLGVLAAVSLHFLNLLLSIMSPTIQSIRLQYVEFLPKFYEGGGVRYEPFKKEGQG